VRYFQFQMQRFLSRRFRPSEVNRLNQHIFLRYNVRQFSSTKDEQMEFKETCATYRQLWPGEEPSFTIEDLGLLKKNTWIIHDSGQPCIIRSIMPMKSEVTMRVALPFVEAYQTYSGLHTEKKVQVFEVNEDKFPRYPVISRSEDDKLHYFKYIGEDDKIHDLKCFKNRGTPMGRYHKVIKDLDLETEMLLVHVQEAPLKLNENEYEIAQFVQGFSKEIVSKDVQFEYIYHDEDEESVMINCFDEEGDQIELSISKAQNKGVLWKTIQDQIEKYEAGEGTCFITCWNRIKEVGTSRIICGAICKPDLD